VNGRSSGKKKDSSETKGTARIYQDKEMSARGVAQETKDDNGRRAIKTEVRSPIKASRDRKTEKKPGTECKTASA